jgi:hypothetical protein
MRESHGRNFKFGEILSFFTGSIFNTIYTYGYIQLKQLKSTVTYHSITE